MPKLPVISAKELIKVLLRLDFRIISQRGSHIKLKRQIGDQERCLTIPNHKVIRKGTLKNILRILDLTNDGLIHLL